MSFRARPMLILIGDSIYSSFDRELPRCPGKRINNRNTPEVIHKNRARGINF